MLPYIERLTDVEADGNCGFRAVACALFDEQEMWRSMRRTVVNELVYMSFLYTHIYISEIE